MKPTLIGKIIICILLGITLLYLFIKSSSENTAINKQYEHSLDSLNNVCDSLKRIKDSEKDTIKKVDNNITIIKKKYEKVYNTVLTQSTDSDCIFFTEYLSKNFK